MRIKSVFFIILAMPLVACSPADDNANLEPVQDTATLNNVAQEQQPDSEPKSDLTSIPMSDSFENGRYFLVSQTTENGIENVEYIRRGNESDSYGKMEIKCSDNKIRKYSAESSEALQGADLGEWTTVTPDWTDADIVNFICKK
jgi:transcription termination factor Rho